MNTYLMAGTGATPAENEECTESVAEKIIIDEHGIYTKVVGDTYIIREELKKMGFQWDPVRRAWVLWHHRRRNGRNEYRILTNAEIRHLRSLAKNSRFFSVVRPNDLVPAEKWKPEYTEKGIREILIQYDPEWAEKLRKIVCDGE